MPVAFRDILKQTSSELSLLLGIAGPRILFCFVLGIIFDIYVDMSFTCLFEQIAME